MRYSDLINKAEGLAAVYDYASTSRKTLQGLTKDSRNINRHLHQRYADKNEIVDIKRTRSLDAAIREFTTPYPLTVFHGSAKTVKPGVYHHAGYLHTSLSIEVAISFANIYSTEFIDDGVVFRDIHHVVEIMVPKGHHGAYVGHISRSDQAKAIFNDNMDEQEFILPRNTKLIIAENPKIKIKHYNVSGDPAETHMYFWKAKII